jgi:hypothetical protein
LQQVFVFVETILDFLVKLREYHCYPPLNKKLRNWMDWSCK